MVICGMHVHVGVEDPDLRIDLMNQVKYFLPHILCFSTSSPFWTGSDTGLEAIDSPSLIIFLAQVFPKPSQVTLIISITPRLSKRQVSSKTRVNFGGM